MQSGNALWDIATQGFFPSWEKPDAAEGGEVHVHGNEHWHREGDNAATQFLGAVIGLDLATDSVGFAAVDREHVPVHDALCCGTQCREQFDFVVGESIKTAGNDAFEAGAFVLADLGGHREHFFVGGPSAWHRLSVAIAVAARSRERPSEGTDFDGLAQFGHHGIDLFGGCFAAHGIGAHDIATDGAMSGHPTGVHRDAILELVEVLLERFPVPIDGLEGGKGHSFDSTHHFLEVFRFGDSRAQGGEGEPTVAGDHGGDAVVC